MVTRARARELRSRTAACNWGVEDSAPYIAATIGGVAGLLCVFMLSIAVGLYTEFTTATRILTLVLCPGLPLTFLFPGAWVFVIVLNAGLHAAVVHLAAKLLSSRRIARDR